MEAICSSKTSVDFCGLHGVISQKIALFFAPYSSIIRGYQKRPISGRCAKWTQSHPTPPPQIKKREGWKLRSSIMKTRNRERYGSWWPCTKIVEGKYIYIYIYIRIKAITFVIVTRSTSWNLTHLGSFKCEFAPFNLVYNIIYGTCNR
jgi:hypothetical protein